MGLKLSDYLIIHISQSNTLKLLDDIQGVRLTRLRFYEDYNGLLKNNSNVIVIISLTDISTIAENIIVSIKFRFNHVPIMVHFETLKIENVRKCGELGVNRVVIDTNVGGSILENITKIINDQVSISMLDFGIDIHDYPILVKNALKIIENNYLRLMGTKEIANILDVSDCTIIREFKKNEVLAPKKLLLYFKVKHSLILMQKDGLNLKEIARLSGFSNEKRFIECFQRFFQKAPSNVRKNISLEFIKKFGIKEANYEIS